MLTIKSIRSIAASGLSIIAFGTSFAVAQTTSYEYDELGRLRKISYDADASVIYELDAAGNRTSESTYNNTEISVGTPIPNSLLLNRAFIFVPTSNAFIMMRTKVN